MLKPNEILDKINNIWHHQDGKIRQKVNKIIDKKFTHRGYIQSKQRVSKMIKLNKMGSAKLRNIENLEEKYNLSLPIDYKEFLLSTNGGSIENDDSNQLAIDGLSEKVVIDVLYGIDTGFEAANIDFWTDKFKKDLLSDTIVIGDSIMNGLFVMICNGEMKGIYYWDDSYHFDTSNNENNTYWIASTFTNFMKMFG